MWQIVVIMLVGMLAEKDAIEITHNNGLPLRFDTEEICYDHVYKNIDMLKQYASSQFDGAPVKTIICTKLPFGV